MCTVPKPGEPGEIDPQILGAYEIGREVGEQKVLRAFHAWTLTRDLEAQRFVWRCTCNHVIYQPFGEPAPADELISHPRGE